MKVFYSPYTLTPLKRANRLSSLDRKHGVYLKGVLGDQTTFADYFPHLPLGDRTCDQFLQEFKFQNVEYDKKVFDLLLRDIKFQNLKPKRFLNHQLWTGSEPIESKILKYKMLHAHDRSFMKCLEAGLRVRLDANALFKRTEYMEFIKDIPEQYQARIDYIEDPLGDHDWSKLKIPSAQDFIPGTPFDYYIYKPNCEFKPETEAKIIYSSYLGSDLGRWHTYSEMSEEADLKLTHGIISQGFYQEENYFYKGTFNHGFEINEPVVKRIYRDLSDVGWKTLCSI